MDTRNLTVGVLIGCVTIFALTPIALVMQWAGTDIGHDILGAASIALAAVTLIGVITNIDIPPIGGALRPGTTATAVDPPARDPIDATTRVITPADGWTAPMRIHDDDRDDE